MPNPSFLLEGPSGFIQRIEGELKSRLPEQLDVRLLPLTEYTAILRGHLVEAYAAGNCDPPLGELLNSVGARAQPINDAQVLARVSTRSPVELPPRGAPRASRSHGVDWHLASCGVPEAWERLSGPSGIAWSVRAGQIDTGYTEHPALGFGTAVPWLAAADSRTIVPERADRENFLNVEPGGGVDPMAGVNEGHGTRIASTICGHQLEADGGPFFGVAPRLPLVMVRVTDSVIVPDRQLQIAEALRYLTSSAGVDVVNISLGFLPPGITDEALKRALSESYEAGVIVVCAAGNFVDPVVVPARLNRTIAVAGVTSADLPWSGSSFGLQVDFSAPAADLRRANAKRGWRRLEFSYGAGGDGTSYAAAMTTGAAALWLQHRHDDLLEAYQGEPWKRVAAFRQLARDCARIPDVSINGQRLWQPGAFGTGILDVPVLLEAELPAQLTREPQP